jgi:hypothetical protein
MDIDALLLQTRAQVTDIAGREITWVGGRVVSPNRLVILVRPRITLSVLGYTWLIDDELRNNDPIPSPEKLAGLFRYEMVEPTSRGFIMNVDWAEGIVDDPQTVIWINPDIEREIRHVVRSIDYSVRRSSA